MPKNRFKNSPPEKERNKEKPTKSSPAKIAAAAVYITVFAAGTIFINFSERPEISETEKRKLAEFPELTVSSYFSGEFAKALDKYYTDTIPHRDALVDASSSLEAARGISVSPKFYGNVSTVNDKNKTEDYSVITTPAEEIPALTDIPQTDSEDVTAPPQTEIAPETTTEEEKFDGNISDFLNNGIITNGIKMYGEQAGIMLYGGNDPEGLHYAEVINSYREALPENINVYAMVIPTSAEFYLPKKFSDYNASERDAIDYIYSNLSEDVIKVDAYSALEAHTDDYIYFRSDHHWTGLGAYYGYTAFCDAAGLTYHSIDEYEKRSKENFIGSLYNYTGDKIFTKSPETFNYYIPPEEYSAYGYDGKTMRDLGPTLLFHEYAEGGNMYGIFLGGDNMHIKVTTNANSGRKLAVFKDSYGNALCPYFVSNFDEIYIIDIRYFGKNALTYINDVGATDVLFADNIFAANTGSLINGIENLMKK